MSSLMNHMGKMMEGNCSSTCGQIFDFILNSCEGERYFECANKYGSFLRPDKLTIGDYPEQDLDGLDDLDEM